MLVRILLRSAVKELFYCAVISLHSWPLSMLGILPLFLCPLKEFLPFKQASVRSEKISLSSFFRMWKFIAAKRAPTKPYRCESVFWKGQLSHSSLNDSFSSSIASWDSVACLSFEVPRQEFFVSRVVYCSNSNRRDRRCHSSLKLSHAAVQLAWARQIDSPLIPELFFRETGCWDLSTKQCLFREEILEFTCLISG